MQGKLGNIFRGKTIQFYQSPHGANQNYKALDLGGANGDLTLIAPCDGVVKDHNKADPNNPKDDFFYFYCKDWKIQFVHGVPTKQGNVKKGDVIGKSTWHHWHVTIQVGGTWYPILDFMDRSLRITCVGDFKSKHWEKWSTWADRSLELCGGAVDPIEELKKEIADLENKLKVLSEQYEDKKKQADKLEKYYNQVVDEKKLIEKSLEEKMDELAKAKNTISIQQNTIEKLKNDLEVETKQSQAQAREIMQNLKEIKTIKDTLKEKQGVLDALQSDNSELGLLVNELKGKLDELTKIINFGGNELKKELGICRANMALMEVEMKKFREFRSSFFYTLFILFQKLKSKL